MVTMKAKYENLNEKKEKQRKNYGKKRKRNFVTIDKTTFRNEQ